MLFVCSSSLVSPRFTNGLFTRKNPKSSLPLSWPLALLIPRFGCNPTAFHLFLALVLWISVLAGKCRLSLDPRTRKRVFVDLGCAAHQRQSADKGKKETRCEIDGRRER